MDSAAPRVVDPPPGTRHTFYRIDSTRVSLREYWWDSPLGAILVAPILKLLRIRIPSATDDPNVQALAPFEIGAEALPETVRTRMAPLLEELEALGFGSPIHHAIVDAFHQVETYLTTLSHPSGRAWARIHERLWAIRTPPKDVLFTELVTELTDGTFLWSLASKPDLAPPPSCRVVRRTGASPTALLALHEGGLQGDTSRRAIRLVGTADELRAAVDRHHAQVRNFHLRRGVFAAMSEADRAKGDANRTARQAAAAGGSQYPDILAEVRRIQERQSSWVTTLLVLLVSTSVFIGSAGTSGSSLSRLSLDALLTLVPILFFHEAGHWLAMRLFGYRNLRMFFIPFLGAAVSGRHYNVPGWKKAVVSLMGPLPGIVVGTILGVIGMLLHRPTLLRIAVTMLALNGFNLLPILPFDGGWVMLAIFASRHAILDVLFRVLAVAGLLAIGVFSHDHILAYVAIFMALAVPVSYKLARITRDVRSAGAEVVSPDDQTIPIATADAIIGRVHESFPKRYNNKLKAQFTLQVFEALNARPPRLLASLGLGFVQGAALVTAILFASLFTVAQGTSLPGLLRAAQAIPTQHLDPAAMVVWPNPASGSPPPDASHITVVATFADPGRAREALGAVQKGATPGLGAELIGQSLLVSVPADDDPARKQWLAELQPKAQDVFVATLAAPAMMRLSCLAPSEDVARAIEQEVGDYLLVGHLHVFAPWAAPDPRTPAERAQHARARRTYARLAHMPGEVIGDPTLKELGPRMLEARRTGDAAEVERLRRERDARVATLRQERARQLRAAPDADPTVVDRYQTLFADPAVKSDPKRAIAELGPLLGQLKLIDGVPGLSADRASAEGYLAREGLLLHALFLRFTDTFEGPPLALRWLQSRGCTDFRYQFTAGRQMDADDDESEP